MSLYAQKSWRRVGCHEPCPICGKPDWCLIIGPVGTPSAAICQRVESGRRVGEAGWLHRLTDDDGVGPKRGCSITVRCAAAADPRADLSQFAAACFAAVKDDQAAALAAELAVTTDSLQRLRVGWAADHRAWTFPMRDAAGNVIGVRLRGNNGHKWSISGGRNGLFLPVDLIEPTARLVVCEGATDTLALLDLGFTAIGRPNCSSGYKLIVQLIQGLAPTEVVVMADADPAGQRGAESLAIVLLAYSATVRVIAPPVGIKDARDWKQAGATTADVLSRMESATARKLTIRTRGVCR